MLLFLLQLKYSLNLLLSNEHELYWRLEEIFKSILNLLNNEFYDQFIYSQDFFTSFGLYPFAGT